MQERFGPGTSLPAALGALAVAAFVASPLLAPEFRGYDADLFPVPQDRPPVQPAGYAFGIWGVIYLWLLAHAAFGLWARRGAAHWDTVRWPLILSLGPGAFWLAIAGVAPVAATVLIFWMLGTALIALWRCPAKGCDRWLLQAPVALYAGWLTAASCVSLGLVLGGFGLTGSTGAAVVALAVAIATAGAMQLARPRAPEYGAAVIWALVGVVVANAGGPFAVAASAGAGIAIMAALILRGASGARSA